MKPWIIDTTRPASDSCGNEYRLGRTCSVDACPRAGLFVYGTPIL